MRKGDWMQTFTGRQFWAQDPEVDDIDIRDIAHSLACQPHFRGHTASFFSIAQHSVLVSRAVAPEFALWGLLHDAAEAYLGDIISPQKRQPEFQFFHHWEARLLVVIAARYGLACPMPEEVIFADRQVLATEAHQLFLHPPIHNWADRLPEPLPIHILPLSPVQAEWLFLQRFWELTGATTALVSPSPDRAPGEPWRMVKSRAEIEEEEAQIELGQERVADWAVEMRQADAELKTRGRAPGPRVRGYGAGQADDRRPE